MSVDTRKFKGVWIPAALWLDHSLSITEKVMLVEIDSLESEDRGCYKKNSEFAKFFGLSISRVSEIISGLAEKGFITVEQIREGNQIIERRIRMVQAFEKPNTPPSENAANPFGKGDEPPSEKAKESNTKRGNTKRGNTKRVISCEKFEEAWRLYPKREGGSVKKTALKAWNGRIREGIDPDVLIAAVKAYAAAMQKARNIGSRYVKQASTFLGPDGHFEEYAPRTDGQADPLLKADASASWWQRAGFDQEWQAINAGATESTVSLWRGGRPIRRLARATVEPWPESEA